MTVPTTIGQIDMTKVRTLAEMTLDPASPLYDGRQKNLAEAVLVLADAAEALLALCATDPSHNRRHNPGWPHGEAHLQAEATLARINFDA